MSALILQFADVLNLDPADVPTAAYGVTHTWTSMTHMELVVRIERQFQVMLETNDIIALDSLASAIDILRAHGIYFA